MPNDDIMIYYASMLKWILNNWVWLRFHYNLLCILNVKLVWMKQKPNEAHKHTLTQRRLRMCRRRMCIVQFVHQQFLENGIWVRERTFVQNICLCLAQHTIHMGKRAWTYHRRVCVCIFAMVMALFHSKVADLFSLSLFLRFFVFFIRSFWKIIFGLIWIVCMTSNHDF